MTEQTQALIRIKDEQTELAGIALNYATGMGPSMLLDFLSIINNLNVESCIFDRNQQNSSTRITSNLVNAVLPNISMGEPISFKKIYPHIQDLVELCANNGAYGELVIEANYRVKEPDSGQIVLYDQQLRPLTLNQFAEVMQAKEYMNKQWQAGYQLLVEAESYEINAPVKDDDLDVIFNVTDNVTYNCGVINSESRK